jgi:hypothetical protein
MKRKLTLLFLSIVTLTFAQVRNEIHIPDIMGYKTLKCDFHMHTVFSDGLVWPTVRVDEAYREGLDAIAITDHIEYRPHKKDIVASHNRAYEIAAGAAKGRGITLIRGSEITRGMPPGHFNALFLDDCDALDVPDYKNAFVAAKAQNAFIFWNHPGWDRQQPDTTLWMKEHSDLYDRGFMQGIEVVNVNSYYPEAHAWALEKKLTFMGNSDIHQPSMSKTGEHRAMTLVFAKDNSEQAIKEALINRRTAVYLNDMLIGEEVYLRAIVNKAVEIVGVTNNKNTLIVEVKNHSEIPFQLQKTEHDPNIVYFRNYTIQPHARHKITIKLENGATGGKVNFRVKNLLVKPNEGLLMSYDI